MLSDQSKSVLERILTDFEFYAQTCLQILTKSEEKNSGMGGAIIPFRLNGAQQYLHREIERQKEEQGKVRIIALKGRQQGISTYVEGRYYWKTSTNRGVRAYILTHRDDATRNLFGMAQRYHDLCPAQMRPECKRSNAKELEFEHLFSGYQVATAGGAGAGRSGTVQLFHGSEVAFWPKAQEHLAGLGQAVPLATGTEVIMESTANGISNVFHGLWQEAVRGEGLFKAVFIPWYWQTEYRMPVDESNRELSVDDRQYQNAYKLDAEQMAWRAYKLRYEFLGDNSLFNQEYPATPELAFQRVEGETFIRSETVAVARRAQWEGRGPLVMGIDPAEMGKDSTAIIFRRGRVLEYIKTWNQQDTMEVVGIAAHLINQREPIAVFVDAVGIGAGVYARLMELFPRMKIYRVMSGAAAVDDEKYANRRAEMWGKMREWMEEGAVIPDDDGLHADLTAPHWGFDSSGRILLEKKEKMKKRGMKSPDRADALALTFAYPIQWRNEEKKESWRDKLMRQQSHSVASTRIGTGL